MKKIVMIFAFCLNVILLNAQEQKKLMVDFGVTKHVKDVTQLTYSLNLKQIIGPVGVWGTFVGLDKNKSITNSLENFQVINSELSKFYGFGFGVNYHFPKCGITVNAGTNFLKQKTVYTYYNPSVTPAQNNETPYKASSVANKTTIRLFVDYDFLRKNEKVELGVRLGYDTFSSAEVGVFLGYKFTK